jgi:hypothetical protein
MTQKKDEPPRGSFVIGVLTYTFILIRKPNQYSDVHLEHF